VIEETEGIEARSHQEETEEKDRLEEIEEEDNQEAIIELGRDNLEESGKLRYLPQVPTASK
jgi:hypothetical protein